MSAANHREGTTGEEDNDEDEEDDAVVAVDPPRMPHKPIAW